MSVRWRAAAAAATILVSSATLAASPTGVQAADKAGSDAQLQATLQFSPMAPAAQPWRVDPDGHALPIAPRRFVRQRQGTFAGDRMAYTVIAADTVIHDPLGAANGSIFSFSYLAKTAPGVQRPVIFVFDGGPGSASLWLHMGVIGPRKVAFQDVTPSQLPPFHVVDNPDSVLAVADLVFIDPIGTGFSRYWGSGSPKAFYAPQQDSRATVEFILSWLRDNHRWNSPKFLLGESYGTTRAALVSRALFGGVFQGSLRGVSLNGVVMVGGDGGLWTPEGNESFRGSLETMAAAAWYHGKVDKAGRSFDAFIAEADRFARDDLVAGIDHWAKLDAHARNALAERMSSFIGLPVSYILSRTLKIEPSDFTHALLADRGQVIGTYDSRYVLPAENDLHDPVADDPAMGQYAPAFVGGFNTYIRDELGIDIDDDYRSIDFLNVNMPFGASGATSAVAGAEFAATMRRNPQMRLMAIEGWFDMLGSVGMAENGIAQHHLPADRVEQKNYRSGHMAYVGDAGIKVAADLKDFIVKASTATPPTTPAASPEQDQ